MDLKAIIFFLINIAAALSNQLSHAYQKRHWNVYNTNTNERLQPGHISTTTTTTPKTSVEDTNAPVENKVNITVYYETFCPASVRFLTQQLKRVVEKLPSHLNVQLVPYGHARTFKAGAHYVFRCQHGPAECYGNKLHACVVDALQNNTQAVLFNACLMRYTAYINFKSDYVSALNWCGYKLNAPINGIWDCVNSERGSLLLKNNGVITHALRPHYVPYLVFDGSLDNQARVNLMSAVCQRLHPAPPPCDYYIM